MFNKNKPSQLIILLSFIFLPMLQGSLAADPESGGSYSYCSGPGFSEPRGFGYSDRHQWRSEFVIGDKVQRNAFLERTRDLRRSITAKERALRSELAQANIDENKAMQLQKELSTLRSQMAQYELEHLIEMRKVDADDANGALK